MKAAVFIFASGTKTKGKGIRGKGKGVDMVCLRKTNLYSALRARADGREKQVISA